MVVRLSLAGGARLPCARRGGVRVAAGLTGLQLREQCLQVGSHLLFRADTGRRPGCARRSPGGGSAALCLDQQRLNVRGELLERIGGRYDRGACSRLVEFDPAVLEDGGGSTFELPPIPDCGW